MGQMKKRRPNIPELITISVSNGETYELEFEFDLKYKRGVGLISGWRLDKRTMEREVRRRRGHGLFCTKNH
jgi:hypothetical protein